MGDPAYKRRHLAQGLCVYCSEKAVPGRTLCKKHLLNHRSSSLKYKKKARKMKRCPDCNTPLHPEMDEGHIYCLYHRGKSLRVPRGVANAITKQKITC
jgi:hypothetical protein